VYPFPRSGSIFDEGFDFAADERAIGHGVRAMASLLTERLAARSIAGHGRRPPTGAATR
jgi:hypothetical protein